MAAIAIRKGNNANHQKLRQDDIEVTCLHVSCKSDKIDDYDKGDDLAGVILYQKDGKNDFFWNNVHIKSGYIIIKKSKNLKAFSNGNSMIHGKVFQFMFNEFPNNGVVAGGFARKDNKWKYNSFMCNAINNGYTDCAKPMYNEEKECIEKTIKNWIQTKKQNYKLEKPLYIHKNQ